MTARKDAVATVLTILVVLAFLATHEAWNVWLIGGSHRWAAGVISLLGVATCAVGTPRAGMETKVCAMLGVVALGLAVLALATGSLTPLSLLVLDIVVLWVIATVGRVRHHARTSTVS
jgi:hypothetical protein